MISEERKAQRYLQAYTHIRDNPVSIWGAYHKPSIAKVRAWQHCKDLCERYSGERLTVVSHNANFLQRLLFIVSMVNPVLWLSLPHGKQVVRCNYEN